jgi:hypothetical protein
VHYPHQFAGTQKHGRCVAGGQLIDRRIDELDPLALDDEDR